MVPLNDVAYCISTSFLDPSDRASAEEELVKEYHALLEVNDNYSLKRHGMIIVEVLCRIFNGSYVCHDC